MKRYKTSYAGRELILNTDDDAIPCASTQIFETY